MNCIEIENQMMDYIDENIDPKEAKIIETHLATCISCSHEYDELMTVINAMSQIPASAPNDQFRTSFLEVIQQEKLKISDRNKGNLAFMVYKKHRYRILRMAAIVLLMLGSYFMGSYKNGNSSRQYVAQLQEEQLMLKTAVTLSLIENTSASKRMQAMNYAEDMDQPDMEVISAIITKMRNDTYVSVRLAAVQALANFHQVAEVRNALLEALEVETDPNMQIQLIQTLVDVQEKRAIPRMKKLLEDQVLPLHLKDQIRIELKHLI